MYCSRCGKENDDNSMFCGECGEKLHIANGLTDNAIKKAIQFISLVMQKAIGLLTKKDLFLKKMSLKKMGIAIFALIIAVVLFFSVFHKSDEEKIIELTNNLAVALNEGDYEKMTACFEPSAQNQMNALLNAGSSLLGSVDLKDLWSLGAVGMTENGDVYISVYDITVEKDTASADISFSFDEGKSDAIGTVELVKIEGKWYFKNF